MSWIDAGPAAGLAEQTPLAVDLDGQAVLVVRCGADLYAVDDLCTHDGEPLEGAEVLELAPGTGIWTEQLIARAAHVTAIDAAPEMVSENRRRLGARAKQVTFVLADLFTWTPARTYDVVVFCFWLSHVPADRLDGFLATIARAVRPGGSVFFIDGRREPTSTAADHVLPVPGEEVMVRRLDDGRAYRIVKNYWPADELERRCAAVGLEVRVLETPTYFQLGLGRRSS